MNILLSKYLSNFNNIWNDKCENYKYLPNILPEVERIIVIGDIHGDIDILYKCLELAKLIDGDKNWIGGETVVVQVGDQIDSCRFDGINSCNDINNYKLKDNANDINILYFMTNLHKKALAVGGAIYSLMGNHELMNVMGDMNYVSYNNRKQFNNYKMDNGNIIQDGTIARQLLFSPGNKISNFLACTRKIALIIGNNLFVHAGIVPQMIKKYKIEDINNLLTLFLLNELEEPDIFHDVLMSGKYSPLWTREFGNSKMDSNKCNELMNPITEVYNVGRIIVGHTPQLEKGITKICKNRIVLTDAGMGEAFDAFDKNYIKTGKKNKHREAQVLEICKNKLKVIK